MSFDVSFITSLINLPCAFKPQTCRPVTRCTYWHVCEWAAYIPLDPHGILGNVWVPCIVHCKADRLLRQLSQWWKKDELTMWTDCSFPSEATCRMSAQRAWARWEQTRVIRAGLCASVFEESVNNWSVVVWKRESEREICIWQAQVTGLMMLHTLWWFETPARNTAGLRASVGFWRKTLCGFLSRFREIHVHINDLLRYFGVSVCGRPVCCLQANKRCNKKVKGQIL